MTPLDRLRELTVIRPRENSTTRFVPFVEVDEASFKDLLAVVEAAQGIDPWSYVDPDATVENVADFQRLVDAIVPLTTEALAARQQETTTHGQGCLCTPCQAEDWDEIDRGIAAHQQNDPSPTASAE